MEILLEGERTGKGESEQPVGLKASKDGDLRIAQYLPSYAMLTASGQVFAFSMNGGTAKAPDTSMSTDSPEWSIYNANPTGGKHLVLLRVGAIAASGSLGLGVCIAATAGIGDQTHQTANYSGTVVSCLDGTLKVPNAFLANNVSIVGTQPSWMVFDSEDTIANVYVGAGLLAKVDGLIVAPPHDSLFVAIVGAAGSSDLYDVCIVVAEMQLDT